MTTTLEIMLADDTQVGFIVAATCVPRVGEFIWLRKDRKSSAWKVVEVAYWAEEDCTHVPGLSRAAVYVEPTPERV